MEEMSVDVEKICRTCLALSGPLLTIFDDGGGNNATCLAQMLGEFTKMQLRRGDHLPEKVCLSCISEINRCYSFKLKCENSNRTLRQMLPDALPEEPPPASVPRKLEKADKNVQTLNLKKKTHNVQVQTNLMNSAKKHPTLKNQDSQTEISKLPEDACLPVAQNHRALNDKREINNAAADLEFLDLTPPESSTRYPKRLKRDTTEAVEPKGPSANRVNCSVKNKITIVPLSPKKPSTNNVKNFNVVRKNTELDEIVYELQETPSSQGHIMQQTRPSGDNKELISLDGEDEEFSAFEIIEQDGEDDMVEEHIVDSDTNNSLLHEGENIILSGRVGINDDYEIENIDNVGNFTILNQANDEITIVPRHSTRNTLDSRGTKNQPEQEKGIKQEYQCPDCIMTFISKKVLKRHLFKKHNYIQDDDGIDEEAEGGSHKEVRQQGQRQQAEPVQTQPRGKAEAVSTANTPAATPAKPTRASRSQGSKQDTETKESGPPKPPYVCEHCNAGFARERSFKYHVNSGVCTRNTYQCQKCEKVFVDDAHLEDHRKANPNCAAKARCTECNKLFDKSEKLSEHMLRVHKRSKKHQCQVCQKVFTMLSTLKDHMRVHTGEKPFLCTLCGHAFTQSSNLRQHMRRHMKEKCFGCQYCPCTFITKSELFSHQRTHTGDTPFQCDMCEASFSSSSSLAQHNRQHTGERPYACEFCPQRFVALSVLRNHRRTHTGERPYKCPDCEKRFSQQGDCLMHMRTHARYKYQCFCNETFKSAKDFKEHALESHSEAEMRKVSEEIDKKRAMVKEAAITITEVACFGQDGGRANDDDGNYSDAEELVKMAFNDTP